MSRQASIPTDICVFHPRLYVLDVEMDAMAPTVHPGAKVAVDPDTMPPRDGSEMGVVEVCGMMYLCRPMQVMGQVVMFFDHPDMRSVTLPAGAARIVGAVVWVSEKKTQREVMLV